MDEQAIHCERLDLVPLTPPILRASLRNDRAEAEQLLGASLPPDWPWDRERLFSLRLEQLEEDASLEPWLLRAMVLREKRAFVGHIGFHTGLNPSYLEPYSPGAIEFGFAVEEPFRRRGFAREASLALMKWANVEHGVTRFILTICPDNVPSQALAAGLGFVKIGWHIDDVDGLEEILELRVNERPVDPISPGAVAGE
jgi:RimJ/RimL family protein N-acetyltransferase